MPVYIVIDRDMIEQICMMLNITLIVFFFLMTRQRRKIKVETLSRLTPQRTR